MRGGSFLPDREALPSVAEEIFGCGECIYVNEIIHIRTKRMHKQTKKYLHIHACMHTYIHTYIFFYTYIHIYRDREREREREKTGRKGLALRVLSLYTYVYAQCLGFEYLRNTFRQGSWLHFVIE